MSSKDENSSESPPGLTHSSDEPAQASSSKSASKSQSPDPDLEPPLAARVVAGTTPPLPLNEDETPTLSLPWHIFDHVQDAWVVSPPPDAVAQIAAPLPDAPQESGKDLTLVTWNVDATSYEQAERFTALIDAVKEVDAEGCPDIIFLQEVSGISKHTLADNQFIRTNYFVAGLDWMLQDRDQQFYNATLMSRRRFARGSCDVFPSLGAAWAVWYPSRYERYALCCDINAPPHVLHGIPEAVRLVNVHFDSPDVEPSHRPRQTAICSQMVHAHDVHGGIVAGDFNPVLPEDLTLVQENDLADCWTQLRGDAGAFPGYTWGIDGTAPFPPARLDKIAYWGVTPKTIEIIHPGTVTQEIPITYTDRASDEEPAKIPWSDHSGLVMTFNLEKDSVEPAHPKMPPRPEGPIEAKRESPADPEVAAAALSDSFVII
ncbi:hypothetical protein Sste5346_007970 [Sporothrix stenoceras]|uniref:Endonuclease/exonuclease/phosphatase domain-containing protein n=1 Tax=Sporothrix stenoceras TaxID=5173 RepID=A0ABR3YRQ4_9PEZI